jgi:LCP family protein required for cell wall assembly
MRFRRGLPFVILLLLLPACRFAAGIGTPTPNQVFTIVAGTLTAHANASPAPGQGATATPLPPVGPGPSPLPTETETPEGSLPPQALPIPQPDGEVSILLMGSDQRPGTRNYRTDTMLLVVLKTDGSVSLVSFPRDLWVYLPGHGMERINTAQEFGGFGLVQATFQYNFGFAPQSFVLTNFNGFRSIVDTLGGIDVQVSESLSDARSGYPGGYTVDPGLVHMDGETALWYIRARKTTSDLDRLRRAQEVILAIGKALLQLDGLSHIPTLYSEFINAVVTDLTLQDVAALLPILQTVDQNRIQRYAIGTDQVDAFITSGGAYVFLPRPDAIRQVLMQALGK